MQVDETMHYWSSQVKGGGGLEQGDNVKVMRYGQIKEIYRR